MEHKIKRKNKQDAKNKEKEEVVWKPLGQSGRYIQKRSISLNVSSEMWVIGLRKVSPFFILTICGLGNWYIWSGWSSEGFMELLVSRSPGHWQQLLEAGMNIPGNLHGGPSRVHIVSLALVFWELLCLIIFSYYAIIPLKSTGSVLNTWLYLLGKHVNDTFSVKVILAKEN